ncbi:MAG: hypothetical protein HYZ58_15190 [Acidobacteria bacterium]|nr:hypothetical protein [Acidobacteriota bacterium]
MDERREARSIFDLIDELHTAGCREGTQAMCAGRQIIHPDDRQTMQQGSGLATIEVLDKGRHRISGVLQERKEFFRE